MEADEETSAAIRALIEQAYKAMSTPGDDVAGVFGHDDMTAAGSGQGELLYGPEQVIGVARMIASHGLTWVPEQVKVWSRDDVAWAQILGYVEVTEDGAVAQVPYWTTGVFGREADGWQWLYWGWSGAAGEPESLTFRAQRDSPVRLACSDPRGRGPASLRDVVRPQVNRIRPDVHTGTRALVG